MTWDLGPQKLNGDVDPTSTKRLIGTPMRESNVKHMKPHAPAAVAELDGRALSLVEIGF